MPLYEFECKRGHKSEHMLSVEDRHSVKVCDECGEPVSLHICPPVTRFKNEKYGHFERSWTKTNPVVNEDPWH